MLRTQPRTALPAAETTPTFESGQVIGRSFESIAGVAGPAPSLYSPCHPSLAIPTKFPRPPVPPHQDPLPHHSPYRQILPYSQFGAEKCQGILNRPQVLGGISFSLRTHTILGCAPFNPAAAKSRCDHNYETQSFSCRGTQMRHLSFRQFAYTTSADQHEQGQGAQFLLPRS